MSIKQRLHYIGERIVVFFLGRCLVGYSAVVTREIARLDQNADRFQAEAIYVFHNHWAHMNEFHQRLLKLESTKKES